jgi:hypothetical protein
VKPILLALVCQLEVVEKVADESAGGERELMSGHVVAMCMGHDRSVEGDRASTACPFLFLHKCAQEVAKGERKGGREGGGSEEGREGGRESENSPLVTSRPVLPCHTF